VRPCCSFEAHLGNLHHRNLRDIVDAGMEGGSRRNRVRRHAGRMRRLRRAEQAYTQGIGKVRRTNVLGAVPELADELVPLPADGHAHPPRDRSDATSGVILIVRSPPRSGLA
jgi:hypothetical protein